MENLVAKRKALVKTCQSLTRSIAKQEFYQISYMNCIDNVQDAFGLTDDSPENTSFIKGATDPKKAANFWAGIAATAFGDLGNKFLTPIGVQLNRSQDARFVEMVFLPENTQTKNAKKIASIMQDNVNDRTKVVLLAGGQYMFGKKVTNKTAQSLVTKYIRHNNEYNVVFVSVKLAQRSFSIPDIDVVHLMYDTGSAAGTGQKGSRCKTIVFGQFDKVAKIVSWSLDPNRDTKLDLCFIEEVLSYKRKKQISWEEAQKAVYESAPLFAIATKGSKIDISFSDYMTSLDKNSSFESVCSRLADPMILPDKIIGEIISACGNKSKLPDGRYTEASPLGKRFMNSKKKTVTRKKIDPKQKDIEKIKIIAGVCLRNIQIIKYILPKIHNSFDECMEAYRKSPSNKAQFEHIIGIPFWVINILYLNGILDKNICSFVYEKA